MGIGDGAGHTGANGGGPGQDRAHPLVWRERPAADDADRGELPGPFRVEGLGRFFLEKFVEFLEEGEIIGMDGVEHHVGDVDELIVVRGARLGQRVDAACFDAGNAGQSAEDDPVGERRTAIDVVAVGQVSVIVGWYEQVFAAFAVVGAGDAHVGDVAEPEVVHDAHRLRRCLDHGRTPRLQIQERRPYVVSVFGVKTGSASWPVDR